MQCVIAVPRGHIIYQYICITKSFSTRYTISIQLIAFGSYIELSINGRVVLSLADHRYQSGQLGVYLESAQLRVSELQTDRLAPPHQTDEHLAYG